LLTFEDVTRRLILHSVPPGRESRSGSKTDDYFWKVLTASVVSIALIAGYSLRAEKGSEKTATLNSFDQTIIDHSKQLVDEGRQTFRFDTFGDESFWGDTLQLHEAIAGSQLGGVGPGLSPAAAAALGLKIDADALPPVPCCRRQSRTG
jgi:hypothetical protein